jgi:DNA anti-recombination protein RmuC
MPRRAAADYASRLRTMAERLPDDRQDMAADMCAMADAFERAINNTNNQAAGVIGLVELSLSDQLDQLHKTLDERYAESVADRRELHSTIDELKVAVDQVLGLLKEEATCGDG